MLSFKKGVPVAKVIGGDYDGKIIRIDKNINKNNIIDFDNELFNIINEDFLNNGRKRFDPMDFEKLKKAIKEKNEPRELKLKNIYNNVMKLIDERNSKEFHIDDGEIVQLPNNSLDRECLYISGPSGSGKSTYVNKFIKQYKEMYPKNEVFLMSRLASDKSLDNNKHIKRIKINEELLDDPIDNSELENSAIIFDDIDTIRDKDLRDYVSDLRDDLLETGRHEKVTMLCTSHLLMDYKKTRTLLNEATSVTFFPNSGSSYHISRFLKVYCGFSNNEIKRVLNLPSRWVTICKTAPMYVLYSQGIYLVK